MSSSSNTKSLDFDISSGSLFKYLKNYPSLYDQWIYGGLILKIISLLFIISLIIIALKIIYIKKFRTSILTYGDFHKALDALGEKNMENIESPSSFDTFMNKVDCDLHETYH